VTVGVEYAIAVDGLAGASGQFVLTWSLEASDGVMPRIVAAPIAVAARLGGDAVFSVQAVPEGVHYQWFRNGTPIVDATSPALNVSPVRFSDLGAYTVQVQGSPGRVVTTEPVNLELGPESTVVTYDKLQDLLNAPPPGAPTLAAPAPSDGYVAIRLGSQSGQVLNNLNSGAQAGEPTHCNVLASGRTRWFGIRVQQNGTVVLDTLGSSIDTVMAVYRWVPDIRQVGANLVTCDLDPGTFASQLSFDVTDAPRDLLIAVDSLGAPIQLAHPDGTTESGLIHLNWQMGLKPTLTALPGGGLAVAGENRVLMAQGEGAALTYRWTFNTGAIPGAEQSQWALPAITPSQAGVYGVQVSNVFGVVSGVARIDVLQPPLPRWSADSGAAATLGVAVASADPGCVPQYEWLFNGKPLPAQNGPVLNLAAPDLRDVGPYQVRVTTCGQTTTVPAGTLSVAGRVSVVAGPLQRLGEFRFPPVSDPVCAVVLETASKGGLANPTWVPVATNTLPGSPLQLTLPADFRLNPGSVFRARLEFCR
jgi:hypothetical protein